MSCIDHRELTEPTDHKYLLIIIIIYIYFPNGKESSNLESSMHEKVTTMTNNEMHQSLKLSSASPVAAWLYGVGFTIILSMLGYAVALVPGFNRVGPMACAILLAVLYRHFFGYPEQIRAGIQFSSKQLLRFAIVLYGLKLNIGVIMEQGLMLLLQDALVIAFAVVAMVWLGRWLKADPAVTFLIGMGTGICGAAAIAVVSSIIGSEEEDTALSVGIIALVGTIFAVAYTILRPHLPLSAEEYGLWSGLSLHEIAHVALAGAPAGEDGLAMALVAKLGRVLLLVPLALILLVVMRRRHRNPSMSAKVEFPWFLVGFILMSLVGSYLARTSLLPSQDIMDGISSATTFLMTTAMVGLGLNISLSDLRQKALRPITVIFIVSIALSLLTFIMVM